MLRDPVLLLPVVVAAGLAVGGLGVHAAGRGRHGSIADLALSWALAAAAIVVLLERPRWRRASWLLAAAAFAVLGADLEWASSHALWTVGFLLEGLWVAFLALLVLTFPEGRSWSRPARFAIAGAFVVTLGGQVVGAFVVPDARDLLSVAPQASVAHASRSSAGDLRRLPSLWSCSSSSCSGWAPLRGAARRSQGPLLAAAAATILAGLVWLGWVIATDASMPRRSRRS